MQVTRELGEDAKAGSREGRRSWFEEQLRAGVRESSSSSCLAHQTWADDVQPFSISCCRYIQLPPQVSLEISKTTSALASSRAAASSESNHSKSSPAGRPSCRALIRLVGGGLALTQLGEACESEIKSSDPGERCDTASTTDGKGSRAENRGQ